MRLLLVEDDEPFGSALSDGLVQDGHSVHWLREGRGFDAALVAQRFDAVLLDLSLPDTDGQALLHGMRARQDQTPVLVLSARGHQSDRIGMLDRGADDYLVKPLDLGELQARLRAVTRRGRLEPARQAVLQHGALRLDPVQGSVSWRGRKVSLGERERGLLELLLRHPEQLWSRAQIETELYAGVAGVDSNAIEVYVHHLRRKITSDVILTVRGRGYRLGPPYPES
jgi:DNA-binding response OmpR family regulator